MFDRRRLHTGLVQLVDPVTERKSFRRGVFVGPRRDVDHRLLYRVRSPKRSDQEQDIFLHVSRRFFFKNISVSNKKRSGGGGGGAAKTYWNGP